MIVITIAISPSVLIFTLLYIESLFSSVIIKAAGSLNFTISPISIA